MLDRRTALASIVALCLAPKVHAQNGELDALIAAIESNPENYPGAANQIEAKELIRQNYAASQPQQGKSRRLMTDRTVRLISAFEVSGRSRYEAQYRRPILPAADSGVTIGIGYDLGYAAQLGFEEDWRDYMNAEDRVLLRRVLGRKRAAARAALADVQAVDVPYDAAHRQFVEQALPKYVAQTEYALENTGLLSGDAMGALVSLTFNRGPSYLSRPDRDKSGRFREMRDIRGLMRNRDFAAIPSRIRGMKRLWQGQPGVKGLLDRREAEAKLFEAGLAATG